MCDAGGARCLPLSLSLASLHACCCLGRASHAAAAFRWQEGGHALAPFQRAFPKLRSAFSMYISLALNHVTWTPLATGEAGRCFLSWAHRHPKLSQVLLLEGGRGSSRVSRSRNLGEVVDKYVSLRYSADTGKDREGITDK